VDYLDVALSCDNYDQAEDAATTALVSNRRQIIHLPVIEAVFDLPIMMVSMKYRQVRRSIYTVWLIINTLMFLRQVRRYTEELSQESHWQLNQLIL